MDSSTRYLTESTPALTPIQQREESRTRSSPRRIKSNVLSKLFNLDRGLRKGCSVIRPRGSRQVVRSKSDPVLQRITALPFHYDIDQATRNLHDFLNLVTFYERADLRICQGLFFDCFLTGINRDRNPPTELPIDLYHDQ